MDRAKKAKAHKQSSICFNCGRSTDPDSCPWVRDFTPVKGWKAEPTVVGNVYRFSSYRVDYCPLFWQDAVNGGLEEVLFGRKRHVHIDGNDTIRLASEICTRAVQDWQYLRYGEIESALYYGNRLKKVELLEFFFSNWFARLLECFSERSPEQIRSYLKITEDMRPKGGKEDRFLDG